MEIYMMWKTSEYTASYKSRIQEPSPTVNSGEVGCVESQFIITIFMVLVPDNFFFSFWDFVQIILSYLM